MKKTRRYIEDCFEGFLIGSSLDGLGYLFCSLDEFLASETNGKAFDVYSSFFDCFRIALEGASFVDLLDALHAYEEQSSVLLDKQRDHLIHSVNVFVLGLSIYAENGRFRDCFTDSRVLADPYDGSLASPMVIMEIRNILEMA